MFFISYMWAQLFSLHNIVPRTLNKLTTIVNFFVYAIYAIPLVARAFSFISTSIFMTIQMVLNFFTRTLIEIGAYILGQCFEPVWKVISHFQDLYIRNRAAGPNASIQSILRPLQPRLIVLLAWILVFNDSLSQRIGSLLRVLQGPDNPPSDVSGIRDSHISIHLDHSRMMMGHTYRLATRSTLVDEPKTKHHPVPSDVYSRHLFTPPATPTRFSFNDFHSRSPCSTRAWLSSQTTPTFTSPTPSSSFKKLFASATTIAEGVQSSLSYNPLSSFDPSDPFIESLVLTEEIGEGAYGRIYRGTGHGGMLFAVKVMTRDGAPSQDSAIQDEINAMERAIPSDWVAKLSYWKYSEEHVMLAMVSRKCSSFILSPHGEGV